MLDDLLAYCREDRRVCPTAHLWNRMWHMMPGKVLAPGGRWSPPPPLILAAWHFTTPIEKAARFEEHLCWASEHGCLP